jgi:phenylacetate-CoA ligase
VNTLWTAADLTIIETTAARTLWTMGCRPGDVILNCFSYGLWVAGLAVHHGARRLGACVIPAGSAPIEHLLTIVQTLRPTVFTGTPSLGLYLAQRLAAASPSERSSVRIAAFGGEPGAAIPGTRRRLEAELGARAHDYYGLSEIGPTLAADCWAGAGVHWNEDHLLVEVLDPRTAAPVSDGTPGVLTVTNLTRVGTPLIRFSTGDIGVLDERRCECGRTLARSPGGILGRADDLVHFRGAKFYPAQVEKVLRAFPALGADYRIDLTHEQGRDRCVISVEVLDSPLVRSDELAVEVCARLRDEILVRPEVRLAKPGELRQEARKPVRVFDEREMSARRAPSVEALGEGM